jgi:protein phosphatase PTC7
MISRQLRSVCRLSTAVAPRRTMSTSTITRPYTFHIGASWAGKPPEEPRRGGKKKSALVPQQGFPPNSEVGRWRKAELERFAFGAKGRLPGEDFFYACSMRDHSVGEQDLCLPAGTS